MEGLTKPASSAASAVSEAKAAVRRDGAAIVEGVWCADTIDAVRELVLRQHPEFSRPELLEDYLGRKGERFIAPVKLSLRIEASGLLASPTLEALCQALLGEDFVYEAFGILMVHPGAAAQNPHRDGGILFGDSGIDKILPPSALTVVIPLVDVDRDCAPTGFAPGSHRTLVPDNHPELSPMILRQGDLAVWDYRVIHGGLANATDRDRPALYLTACRPFWVDHKNFVDAARAKLIGEPAVIERLGPRFVRAQPSA